jgi:glycosyltransferase involved in cell wall biosynthesis
MLIAALRDQGHDVKVVAATEQAAAEFTVSAYRQIARRVLPDKAALVLRDVGRWLHGRSHGARLAAAAQAFQAEAIVETQVNYSLSGVVAAKKTDLPLLLDDCAPTSEEEALGAGLVTLARRVLREQFAAAAIATVPSFALRDRFINQGLPADKLLVVPNGVNPETFTDRRSELRSAHGFQEDCCVLGFVGSFQPWHDVHLLVEALVELRHRHSLHLVLVGDGPDRASVQARTERLELRRAVTFLGSVDSDQVPSLLSMIDIGLLPGANDYSHPMKLIEYGAAGLPSIAPDVAPVREVLRHERNGLLFRKGDISALSAAISRLAGDPALRHKLGSEARGAVLANAKWDDRAQEIAAALARLTAAGTTRVPPSRSIDLDRG